MATDVYQFPNAEMRDLAYQTEIARGSRGVTKSTDQINNKMVYILSVPCDLHGKRVNSDTQLDTQVAENAQDMIAEGGPDV